VGCAEEEDGIRGVALVAADYACCRPFIGAGPLKGAKG